MRSATVSALNRLNQAFYTAIADDWTLHRNHAWPGWDRVLAERRRLAAAAPLPVQEAVLDVGAGDGRFALYLMERWEQTSFDYHGLDVSAALLATARARTAAHAARVRWTELDVLSGDFQAALSSEDYTLIGVFGVLHHVPSLALRRQLIGELARRLRSGGLLALTFWRLMDDSRFERRVLPWTDYNTHAAVPIDVSDLEPGDTLLRWGTQHTAPRYCHFADDAEIQSLITDSGLELVTRFRSDGRDAKLNEYVLLTRP